MANGAMTYAAADHRQSLEQLCRYITRPTLPNERVQDNAADQVAQKLQPPWHDGSKPVVMSPPEVMSGRLRECRGCAGHSVP